jgi:CelD/BcsL family acetyltransferase involved in cellulose biosynthesis
VTAPLAMATRLLTGRAVLQELGTALDDLFEATNTPITARRPWLQAWVDCHPEDQPLAVVVDGERGDLEAVALLAARRRFRLLDVVALGHGPSDYIRLPARTPQAARRLADALAAALAASSRFWRLRLEQLPPDDAVAAHLASSLPRAIVRTGDSAPRVRFQTERDVEPYLSRNTRSMLANRTNRLKKAGLVPEVAHLRQPHDVERVLAELEHVRRERDAALLRVSDLDQPGPGCFWRRIIVELAGRGEAEVTTLRLEDELAAYCVCLLDGPAYRYWDGRFLPGWDRFSPGALVLTAALRRALADPAFNEFDWMRGSERFKQGAANDTVSTQQLLAWSSPAMRAVTEAPRRAETAVRRIKDRNELLQRVWRAGKALRLRLRARAGEPGSGGPTRERHRG